MKKCFKCKKTKSLDNFYRHSRMADGRLNKCSGCTRKDTIENRKNKREYYLAYDAARAMLPNRIEARKRYVKTKKGKAVRRESNQRWIAKNPEKRLAHSLVNNAILRGKLKRKPCSKCGTKAHAHHDDYSKPFEIIWLCPKHHKERHRLLLDP